MELTRHVPELSGNRVFSSCAVLNSENGEKLVAVASGYSPGMETWNTNNGTVKYVTTDFPHSFSGGYAQMISIDSGNQLLLYIEGEIWNYSQASKSWIKIGNMLQFRINSLALPLKNITCN